MYDISLAYHKYYVVFRIKLLRQTVAYASKQAQPH